MSRLKPTSRSATPAVASARMAPLPPVFPFRWAVAHGEDEYGLWQAFELAGVRQRLRWMPPPLGGTFWMSSRKDRLGHSVNEDLYEASVGGFWMADTTVTQALWMAVMGKNPSLGRDHARKPVERVSWYDIADKFLPRANAMLTGLEMRLPLETEWEYAARAAGQVRSAYWWGDQIGPADAHYGQEWEAGSTVPVVSSTVPVDSFSRNAQGLWVLGDVQVDCQRVAGASWPSTRRRSLPGCGGPRRVACAARRRFGRRAARPAAGVRQLHQPPQPQRLHRLPPGPRAFLTGRAEPAGTWHWRGGAMPWCCSASARRAGPWEVAISQGPPGAPIVTARIKCPTARIVVTAIVEIEDGCQPKPPPHTSGQDRSRRRQLHAAGGRETLGARDHAVHHACVHDAPRGDAAQPQPESASAHLEG